MDKLAEQVALAKASSARRTRGPAPLVYYGTERPTTAGC